MLENEPFEKLPWPYIPLAKVNHYPPILGFGFAIPNHVPEFLRVALEHKLGDPEKLNAANDGGLLQKLVTSHLNDRCGLPREQGIVCKHIRSRASDMALLEIETDYRMQVPEDKVDEMLGSIREVFSLPDDAHPRWYLETDVVGKDPDGYRISSESPDLNKRFI